MAALKRDVEPYQWNTDLGHPSLNDEADDLRLAQQIARHIEACCGYSVECRGGCAGRVLVEARDAESGHRWTAEDRTLGQAMVLLAGLMGVGREEG